MAKTSSVEKNKRRSKMAKQYAAKRAKLKAMAVDDKLPPEERFAARLKLAELPRNSSPTRIRNRCELTGRPRAVYRKFKLSRIALRELAVVGQISRHGEGELVTEDRDHVDDRSLRRYADPHPQRPVGAPRQRDRRRPRGCASNVLDVLQREGYIRGWFEEELRPGVKELRIELKYDEGRRSSRRSSASPTRAAASIRRSRELPRHYNGLGISILSTPRGVMSDAEARAANVGGEVLCQVF